MFFTHAGMAGLAAPVGCRNLGIHALSVPQFRPRSGVWAVQGLGAVALEVFASRQVRPRQLLNVVHDAVQVPLRVDLDAPAVVQAGQALVVPKVGKHWLDRAKALAVELPAP